MIDFDTEKFMRDVEDTLPRDLEPNLKELAKYFAGWASNKGLTSPARKHIEWHFGISPKTADRWITDLVNKGIVLRFQAANPRNQKSAVFLLNTRDGWLITESSRSDHWGPQKKLKNEELTMRVKNDAHEDNKPPMRVKNDASIPTTYISKDSSYMNSNNISRFSASEMTHMDSSSANNPPKTEVFENKESSSSQKTTPVGTSSAIFENTPAFMIEEDAFLNALKHWEQDVSETRAKILNFNEKFPEAKKFDPSANSHETKLRELLSKKPQRKDFSASPLI